MVLQSYYILPYVDLESVITNGAYHSDIKEAIRMKKKNKEDDQNAKKDDQVQK